ncbi:MAG: FecCD family ABC transporter permease [Gemmatimonadales bacterium]
MSRSRWPLLLAFAGIALVAGVGFGAVAIPPARIWAALTHRAGADSAIVLQLRIPRVLLAFLVGGSLAVCGAVLQALIRNPLADPYLLGLSGGAALGAVLVLALGMTASWSLPAAAFAGAIAVLGLVYRLSLVEGRRLDSNVLLLAGVVASAFTGALVSAILVLTEAARLRSAYLWLLGGFGLASWETVGVFAAYAAVPLGLLLFRARSFDLLSLGDETARHLGADPERLKRLAYVATGLLTAAAVAACGMIGFVGLVVPHAIRRLWGPLHTALLPSAFVLGGAFLVLADALARSIAPPVELPVGVVTALVGVPLFAVLLRRSLA